MKKLFIFLFLTSGVLGSLHSKAQSQYINIIVAGGPGSSGYTLAEILRPVIQQTGEETIIVPKPGAGGLIATDFARKEKSYKNLLIVGGGIAKYESVVNKDFQPLIDDFQFVGPVLSTPFLLATNDPNIKTARDIFENNQTFTVTSTSAITQKIIEELNDSYPGKFIAIPYKDTKQAWVDFIGGHVNLCVDRATWFAERPYDTIKIVGNTTSKQIGEYPSLKKFVSNLDVRDDAIGVMVSRNAPNAFVKQIELVLYAYYKSPAVVKKLHDNGYSIIENTNRTHNAQLAKEIKELSAKTH
jgi:tripartite-type tricarboxylate transporter receptor subunit TctC